MTATPAATVARVGPVTAADHRSNNFDALRLIGALLVILGHGYALTGRGAEIPVILGHPLQTIGVIIFFSISGYLITASWSRTKNPLTYGLARCLRIFPALILVVVVTALVLGPWVTTLPRDQYFADPATSAYIVENIKLHVLFGLPGVWGDLPYPMAVNGSLWTLFVEFLCYLAVPFLFIFPRFVRPLAGILAIVIAVRWAEAPIEQSPLFWGVRLRDAAGLWVFFAAGAFLRMLSERFAWFRFRTDVAVAGMAGLFLVQDLAPALALEVSSLAIPYAVLTIGLARTPYIARSARFGDFSYGLYLWAFPVQQLVIDLWGVQRMSINLIMVVGFTLALAIVSWYLVEQPSMKLKDAIIRATTRRTAPAPAPGSEPVPTRPEGEPAVSRGAVRP